MTKELVLNEGAQKLFVNNSQRASAYIGGLGSGKTFAGIIRGLKFSQQPRAEGTIYGPRGCIAAINYPVLKDVVLPQFWDMVEGTDLVKNFAKSELKVTLKNNAEIIFRSLDKPNWMRGLELSWFFIDEGRHVTGEAWDVLYGRLRQKGYVHAGWCCSTPNGYDWQWEKFHDESPHQLSGAQWFGAPTTENKAHLPEAYIKSLMATYEGGMLRQEVYGEFVGVTEGAVFYGFEPADAITDVPYDPDLPLHSMWDFGVSDLQTVIFGQPSWKEKVLDDGTKEYVPVARIIGSMEGTEKTAAEWAFRFRAYCDEHYGGRDPDLNVGDPAGRQRNGVSMTSVIEDLATHGVFVAPAPKKGPDYAIRIANNMMEGNRVLVDRTNCGRVAAALASHKWPVDPAGNRTGTKPVHDWTSHYADAFRYWLTVVFSVFPRREPKKHEAAFHEGQHGYHVTRTIDQPVERWLGAPTQRRRPVFIPPTIQPRSP